MNFNTINHCNRALGNGEVDSSILSGSTIFFEKSVKSIFALCGAPILAGVINPLFIQKLRSSSDRRRTGEHFSGPICRHARNLPESGIAYPGYG